MDGSGMKNRTAIIWLIGLLALVSLACSQSGEILTPEEATAKAMQADVDAAEENEESDGGEVVSEDFSVGDSALLVGRGFLINLYDEPGGQISAGQERGATVEVLGIELDNEGDLWYQIDAPTGVGWVPGDALEPLEEEAVEGEDADEDGDSAETDDAATVDGPQVGDTVYLTARGFLVNLVDEAGGTRIIAGQERGVPVTVVDVEVVDGTPWYLVDAPTGEGWVPADNVTTEAP